VEAVGSRRGDRADGPIDVSGERRMLRMLLDLSIEDARIGCPDASAWFWEQPERPARLLTYEDVCHWLGLDPDHLRRILHRARPSSTRRRMTVGQDRRESED
jgi:hypothetical protein